MEANKSNLNIRALANDDALSSFKLYFKSIFTYRPSLDKHAGNDQKSLSNNLMMNVNARRDLF